MPYDEADPRVVSADALSPLSDPAHSLPRLAVVGEFSSGKSTLLNLLLGQDILPTKATATASPAIWLSHGEAEGFYIDAKGDRQVLPEGGIADVPSDSRYIRLWNPADFLQSCDVLDLSGLADPGRPDEVTYEMLGHAHCVIWCTPATQAWRQSERAAWLAVPERIRARSILAVTRIDKLRQAEDLTRVMRRVEHEAEGLFCAFAPISAPMAQKALTNDDEEAWNQSGIDALTEALFNQLQAIRDVGANSLGRLSLGQEESAADDLTEVGEPPAEAVAELAAEFPELSELPSTEAELPIRLKVFAKETGDLAPLDVLEHDRAAVEEVLILTEAAFTEIPSEPELPDAEGTANPPSASQKAKPAPLILVSPDTAPQIPIEPIAEASLAPVEVTDKKSEFDIAAFTQQLMGVEVDPLYDGDLAADPVQPMPNAAATAAPGQLSPVPEQPMETVEVAASGTESEPRQPTSDATEAAMIPDIEAALQRVLAGYFGAKPATSDAQERAAEPAETQAPAPQSPPGTPPQQVLIWREITARTEVAEPLKPIVSMIDELLSRLFDPSQTRSPMPSGPARAPELH